MGKLRVNIVGTHGVPAKYGGFETLAEMLCRNLSDRFEITVYCNSTIYPEKRKDFFGSKLIYVPLHASGFKGIFYDIFTYFHALFNSDIILYLSPVGSGFITPVKKLFRNKKLIVNHGGLNEWEREKLSPFKQKWAKFNHRIAAKNADINIADNFIYQKSLKNNFNANSLVIKYGGDHVKPVSGNNEKFIAKYPFVNQKYAISVSRAQTDNNLHILLEAFEKFEGLKLVLISNWNVSNYGKDLYEKYESHGNIILLDAIYIQEELNFLRSNAYVYLHSHSRCGTAPSLVEAMCLNIPVISFDVGTNRETTDNSAIYFSDQESLVKTLESLTDNDLNANKEKLFAIASEKYKWNTIAKQYEKLFTD